MNPTILQQLEGLLSDARNSEKELIHKLELLISEHKQAPPKEIPTYSMSDLIQGFMEDRNIQGRPERFITPWEGFNTEWGGFDAGELVIIGSRPGVGKSNVLHHLALFWTHSKIITDQRINQLVYKLDLDCENPVPVLFHTLETTKEKLTLQLLARAVNRSRNHLFEEDELLLQFSEAVNSKMNKRPLYICDQFFETISEWVEYLERMIEDHGIRVIFIDYIQLLGFGHLQLKRHHELEVVVRMLKQLCGKYNVLIIAAAQLIRQSEYRGDHRPLLSDLNGSSALEAEADKVVMLYRPACYNIQYDYKGNYVGEDIEFIMTKNKSGTTGSVTLKWDLYSGMIADPDLKTVRWNLNFDRMKELENDND